MDFLVKNGPTKLQLIQSVCEDICGNRNSVEFVISLDLCEPFDQPSVKISCLVDGMKRYGGKEGGDTSFKLWIEENSIKIPTNGVYSTRKIEIKEFWYDTSTKKGRISF